MNSVEHNGPGGLFVTGTDTGVGKSVVTAALALMLRRKGVDVGVMKPVETGVKDLNGLGEDGELLRWAADSSDEEELICPYRFRDPLAPSEAAKAEERQIDAAVIVEAARTLRARHQFLLVEGAGGLMVPLRGGMLIADLARQIGLPLLIVARPNLGTINHTLLTTFAAQQMGLQTAGFFINNMPAEPDTPMRNAPYTLVTLASADLLGVLPSATGDIRQVVTEVADQMEKLDTLPWMLMNFGLRHLL